MATELYQFRIAGVHTIEPWEIVNYFVGENLNAGDVIVNARSLISVWTGTVLSDFLELLPETVQIMRLTAKRQDDAGGIEIVQQYQVDENPGAVGGGATAQQLCPIVRLIPPMGTKSAGRFFLPAIAEADIANNIPVAGWVTRLATYMNQVLAGIDGGGAITWTQGIFSRTHDSFVKAMDYDTSPVVGWQSRRRRPV